MTTTIHFSGLYTEPAPLFHPASYSGYPACTWTSLLTCWLSFNQVGLSQYVITHWVTITNFIPIYVESQGFGLPLARQTTGWLAACGGATTTYVLSGWIMEFRILRNIGWGETAT